MFFPYKDDNPRVLVPYVTYAILALNVLIFMYQALLPNPVAEHAFALRYGIIPAHFWGGDPQAVLAYNQELLSDMDPRWAWAGLMDVHLLPGIVTLFTSPFLHGGWLHIIGNMLFIHDKRE